MINYSIFASNMNEAFISFFSIKAWNRADFSDNKHTAHNRIVNQHCMNYYCECWKDRN